MSPRTRRFSSDAKIAIDIRAMYDDDEDFPLAGKFGGKWRSRGSGGGKTPAHDSSAGVAAFIADILPLALKKRLLFTAHTCDVHLRDY